MATTMLELVTQVTNELGVPTPASVAGNTNQDIVQILALMNASGYELLRKADWRQLTKPYSFYTSYLTTTGTYSPSARAITGIPSTSGLDTTYMIVGSGFPNATFVESVDSGTQVTATQFPEETVTAGTVYFQKVKCYLTGIVQVLTAFQSIYQYSINGQNQCSRNTHLQAIQKFAWQSRKAHR